MEKSQNYGETPLKKKRKQLNLIKFEKLFYKTKMPLKITETTQLIKVLKVFLKNGNT